MVGQYVQPVTEWIMPEANVPGLELPSYPFETFDHLVKGAGPFVEAEPSTIFGPLDPFPGASQPVAAVCSVGNTDNLGNPVAAISPAVHRTPSRHNLYFQSQDLRDGKYNPM